MHNLAMTILSHLEMLNLRAPLWSMESLGADRSMVYGIPTLQSLYAPTFYKTTKLLNVVTQMMHRSIVNLESIQILSLTPSVFFTLYCSKGLI